MNIEQIKNKLRTSKYDFLREDKNLGNNIIFLTLGGSHAYGTNNENSDLDIRGCVLNSKMQILTNENFEQFVNEKLIQRFIHLISWFLCLVTVIPTLLRCLGTSQNIIYMYQKLGKN